MKCFVCGGKMKKERPKFYHYIESGLSKIYLKGIEDYRCSDSECGEEEISIPQIERLHEVIAMDLASQEAKLLPEEIRFLRTYLGLSGADFASVIGVSPETVSRWEKGSVRMKHSAERLLRVLILSQAGPFRNYREIESFAIKEKKTPKRREIKTSGSGWSVAS